MLIFPPLMQEAGMAVVDTRTIITASNVPCTSIVVVILPALWDMSDQGDTLSSK